MIWCARCNQVHGAQRDTRFKLVGQSLGLTTPYLHDSMYSPLLRGWGPHTLHGIIFSWWACLATNVPNNNAFFYVCDYLYYSCSVYYPTYILSRKHEGHCQTSVGEISLVLWRKSISRMFLWWSFAWVNLLFSPPIPPTSSLISSV